MIFTTIKKLYNGEFQYSIVLRLANGDIFQGKDTARYTRRFNSYMSTVTVKSNLNSYQRNEYIVMPSIYDHIMSMENFATRFELPRLHVYTNNYEDITALQDLAPTLVISIGLPPAGLEKGMVYMPETPYEFRVTLGSVTKINKEFVEWAEGNKNVRLQPRTKQTLESPGIYNSGTQLFVNGERNLLVVRLHLGNVNLTVDRILK
jgi:hypothetical protein